MNIIICLDDKNGLLFNRRRQSRDSVLCERVVALSSESSLWMNEYSASLFSDEGVNVDSDFLEKAGKGDYCFIENVDFTPYLNKIEKIIIYRWNRVYPSDTVFDDSVLTSRTLMESTDFAGFSHEKITEEIYE